jgi:hypothetical protein
VENLFAFACETSGFVWHQTATLSGTDLLAQIGLSRSTEFALFALWSVQWNNVVSWGDTGDTFTNTFDNTCTFVTQNDWEDTFRVFARPCVDVSVAQCASDDLHTYFTLFWWCDFNFFYCCESLNHASCSRT